MTTRFYTKSAENSTTVDNNKLLTLLAAAGASFTLVGYRWKGPVRSKNGTDEKPAEGWQHSPYTLDEALTWSGNVGILCGDYSDGIGAIDADDDAGAYMDAWPQLRNAIQIWRADAPERRKWIVRCRGYVGGVDKPADIDRLFNQRTGGGANCVIAGTHEGGAVIQWGGTEIPELTADEVDAIHAWRRQRAGVTETAHKPRSTPTDYTPRQQSGGDTLDAVKRTWQTIDVFRHHGMAGEAEQKSAGGWDLHGGYGGLIIKADGVLWYCHGDQVGGDQLDAWAWCTRGHRLNRSDKTEFIDVLREMATAAGIPFDNRQISQEERASAQATIDAVKAYLDGVDFAELVPIHLQAVNGYRTNDTDRIVANAALNRMRRAGTLDLRISKSMLHLDTGKTRNACAAAMTRLSFLFDVTDNGPREAPTYSVKEDLRRLTRYSVERAIEYPGQSTQLPIDTHAGHDAFVRSMTPMTQAELDERIVAHEEKRLDILWHNKRELATGVPQELLHVPGPLDPNRYKARLAAILPSAGPAVLLVVNAIIRHGAMTRKELAAALHKRNASSVSRAVRRGIDLLILEDAGGLLYVSEDWAELVDTMSSAMPTAGAYKRRYIAQADATIAWCDEQLNRPDLAQDERDELHMRMQRAANRKALLAGDESDLPHKNADVVGLTLWDWLKAAKAKQRHADARLELAAERHADQWRLVAEIQQLRRDGYSKHDAARMLEYADWERRQVWAAMASAWPQAVAA